MGWESNAIFQVVIIQGAAGSGLFAYSPSPGAGKLVASIAAAGGTDPYGNVYLPGLTSYAASIGFAVTLASNSLVFSTAPPASNGAGPWTTASSFTLDASPATLLTMIGPSKGLNIPALQTGGLQSNGAAATDQVTLINALAGGKILTVQDTTASPSAPIVQLIAQAIADFTLGIQVTGDTNQRFRADSNGNLNWGSGAAPTDTSLSRSAAGQLTVGSTLKTSGLIASGAAADQVILSNGLAGGDVLKVTNTTAAPTGASAHLIAAAAADRLLALAVTGDTVTRLLIDSNGKMSWGPGGAAAQDTDLFRAAVGVLQTDSTLAITNQATPAILAGAAQLYAASGQPAYKNPAGLAANLSGSQLAVVTQNTVTQVAFTNLASATIPAADAEIGAVYKLTAYGSGVWGSTQQQLTFGARFGATAATVAAQQAIANTALAASAAFEWWAEVIASNVTTGAGATWQVLIRGTVTQTANPLLPGTAANNTIPFAAGTTAAAPYTLDSTIAELLGVSALWASTTGAPTLTKTASFFERIA